jgi:hypothetical protein
MLTRLRNGTGQSLRTHFSFPFWTEISTAYASVSPACLHRNVYESQVTVYKQLISIPRFHYGSSNGKDLRAGKRAVVITGSDLLGSQCGWNWRLMLGEAAGIAIFESSDWAHYIRTVVRQYLGDVAEEGLGAFDLADKAIGEDRIVGNLVHPGDDDNGQLRPEGPHDFGQLSPDHNGHHLIREDEVHVMLIEQLQRLSRGNSRQNCKSLPGENHRAEGPRNLIVVHTEDHRVIHGRSLVPRTRQLSAIPVVRRCGLPLPGQRAAGRSGSR